MVRACMVIGQERWYCGWHAWPLTNPCMCRGKLMSMAGVLSQCVGSRSADDANRLMQPIVRAVTKDVQLGAKPATSSLTAKDADQVAPKAFGSSTSKDGIDLYSAWLFSRAWIFGAFKHFINILQ